MRWVVANFSDFAGQLGVGLLICVSAWEGSPDDLLSLHLLSLLIITTPDSRVRAQDFRTVVKAVASDLMNFSKIRKSNSNLRVILTDDTLTDFVCEKFDPFRISRISSGDVLPH